MPKDELALATKMMASAANATVKTFKTLGELFKEDRDKRAEIQGEYNNELAKLLKYVAENKEPGGQSESSSEESEASSSSSEESEASSSSSEESEASSSSSDKWEPPSGESGPSSDKWEPPSGESGPSSDKKDSPSLIKTKATFWQDPEDEKPAKNPPGEMSDTMETKSDAMETESDWDSDASTSSGSNYSP